MLPQLHVLSCRGLGRGGIEARWARCAQPGRVGRREAAALAAGDFRVAGYGMGCGASSDGSSGLGDTLRGGVCRPLLGMGMRSWVSWGSRCWGGAGGDKEAGRREGASACWVHVGTMVLGDTEECGWGQGDLPQGAERGWTETGCGRPAAPSRGGNVPSLTSNCLFPPAAGMVPSAGDSSGGSAPAGAGARAFPEHDIPPSHTPGRLFQHPGTAACPVRLCPCVWLYVKCAEGG